MSLDERLPETIREEVRRALAEDVGDGDLTAALIPAGAIASATVICREPGILCGSAWFDEVFWQLEGEVEVFWNRREGDPIASGETLCTLQGHARTLLTGERTALNFLQTLSGTATLASLYARAVEGTGCRVLDTRKTLPGLRLAQKHAVRTGGCHNHRIGLFDAILIKENHITACGGIAPAVERARASGGAVMIEVEVENLQELRQAIDAHADRILLDNFDLDTLREAVTLTAGRIPLEASGNVSLENIRAVAETGVDFVSVGGLTKHLRALDLSMRILPGC